MTRTTTVVCPHCKSSLKSANRVPAGKNINCPRCATSFTVPPDEGRSGATEGPGKVHLGRLNLVMFAALLYLLGGTALAYYCFERSFRKAPPAEVPPLAQQDIPDDAPSDSGATAEPAQGPMSSVDAAEQRKIDDAIVKGVWYLKDHQLGSGSWGDGLVVGYAALPALTLLECGLPGSDPVVQKAAKLVREQASQGNRDYDTYQRAVALLLLDRLGDPKDVGLIQHLALCLIAGQRADDGGWAYASPPLDRKLTTKLLKSLRARKTTLDQWRKAALGDKSWQWVRPEFQRSDNSNTQFAVLALWAAQRHGVPIDKPMVLVEKRFRTTQLPSGPDVQHGKNLNMDGSWPYRTLGGSPGYENPSPWPTMTCAGLLGLAVAHGLAPKETAPKDRPLEDPCIRKALAMLGREIDRPGEQRPMDLYFLWSLERVGVLYNLPLIEHKDWYAWGRQTLLTRQHAEGHWHPGGYPGSNPAIDTCFALLFLKRANLTRDLTSKLRLLAEEK